MAAQPEGINFSGLELTASDGQERRASAAPIEYHPVSTIARLDSFEIDFEPDEEGGDFFFADDDEEDSGQEAGGSEKGKDELAEIAEPEIAEVADDNEADADYAGDSDEGEFEVGGIDDLDEYIGAGEVGEAEGAQGAEEHAGLDDFSAAEGVAVADGDGVEDFTDLAGEFGLDETDGIAADLPDEVVGEVEGELSTEELGADSEDAEGFLSGESGGAAGDVAGVGDDDFMGGLLGEESGSEIDDFPPEVEGDGDFGGLLGDLTSGAEINEVYDEFSAGDSGDGESESDDILAEVKPAWEEFSDGADFDLPQMELAEDDELFSESDNSSADLMEDGVDLDALLEQGEGDEQGDDQDDMGGVDGDLGLSKSGFEGFEDSEFDGEGDFSGEGFSAGDDFETGGGVGEDVSASLDEMLGSESDDDDLDSLLSGGSADLADIRPIDEDEAEDFSEFGGFENSMAFEDDAEGESGLDFSGGAEFDTDNDGGADWMSEGDDLGGGADSSEDWLGADDFSSDDLGEDFSGMLSGSDFDLSEDGEDLPEGMLDDDEIIDKPELPPEGEAIVRKAKQVLSYAPPLKDLTAATKAWLALMRSYKGNIKEEGLSRATLDFLSGIKDLTGIDIPLFRFTGGKKIVAKRKPQEQKKGRKSASGDEWGLPGEIPSGAGGDDVEDDGWGLGPISKDQGEDFSDLEGMVGEDESSDEESGPQEQSAGDAPPDDMLPDEEFSFSTADMLMDDEDLGLGDLSSEFGGDDDEQEQGAGSKEGDSAEYAGFVGKLKKGYSLGVRWCGLLYKFMDKYCMFERNWWKILDFIALIILTFAFATFVSYFLWHRP